MGRTISNGKKSDGSTKYSSVYAKTYHEVKQLLKNAESSKNISTLKSKYLFSDVLDAWMQKNSLGQKAATKLKYENLIKKHIKPNLGGYDICEINESIINEYLEQKLISGRLDKKGGLSSSYVKTMLIIIKATMKYGAEQNLCKELKSSFVKIPTEKNEIVILNPEEQKKLESALENDTSLDSLGILISLNTGLRIGEVCALRWDDVDLKNRILHVRHTIARIKNTDLENNSKTMLIIDKPKTKSSIRDIPITSHMYTIFSNVATTSVSNYVISNSTSFINPRTFEYRFHKKLDTYNINQVNYHALRHTFATRCIEKGVDVKTLSEILGHSNVSITLNTYVHSSMTLKREQLEKLILN